MVEVRPTWYHHDSQLPSGQIPPVNCRSFFHLEKWNGLLLLELVQCMGRYIGYRKQKYHAM